MGAVSMKLMPRSSALRQVAIAASSGTTPHSRPPIAQVPRPMRETSALPTFVVSMHEHLMRTAGPMRAFLNAQESIADVFIWTQVKLRFKSYAPDCENAANHPIQPWSHWLENDAGRISSRDV